MLRVALVAGSVCGAWWAAQHSGKARAQLSDKEQHERDAARRAARRRKRQADAAGININGGGGPGAAAAPLAAAPAVLPVAPAAAEAPPVPPFQAPWAAGLLIIFIEAVALFAEHLRPSSYGREEWRRLAATAAVALAAAVFAASAWAAERRHSRSTLAATATTAHCGSRTAAVVTRRRAAAAAAAVPAAPVVPAAVPLQNLTGVWIKDRSASDSMDAACDVMNLGGLIRTAIRLVKGVQLRHDKHEFRMELLSGILWFRITEAYPMDGSSRQYRRRDLRKGKHTCHAEPCPTSGGLLLKAVWGEPYGGVITDHFGLVGPDVLHVNTQMTVGGRTVRYRIVYRRKA